ncbi:MAG: ATP-binding cassette domain-containing protein [Rhodobacterales bacterium]|nr:ATP-binding cassette domain-containing protein [Rhodobacterales bacterium]
MTALLEARDVTVRFGGVTAIDGVSFAMEPGELLGLIGPNGAGKTTMMRAITGVVTPDQGTVVLAGRDLKGLGTAARIRRGLGLSQQLVRPFRDMTVLDNVALAAGHAKTAGPWGALARVDRSAERDRARDLLDRVGIADVADAWPGNLPLGFLKRLEVARALALDPQLLLLDEPLAGLNQIEAGQLADTIVDLNRQGLSIVLIEHNLGEVLRICTRIVVLDNGRRIGMGEPRAVMADPVVRAAYLGEGGGHAAA